MVPLFRPLPTIVPSHVCMLNAFAVHTAAKYVNVEKQRQYSNADVGIDSSSTVDDCTEATCLLHLNVNSMTEWRK